MGIFSIVFEFGALEMPWIKKTKDSLIICLGFMLITLYKDSVMNHLVCWREIAAAAMTDEQKEIIKDADYEIDFDRLLGQLRYKAYQYSQNQ